MRAWPVGMAAVVGAAFGGALVGWSVRMRQEPPPSTTSITLPVNQDVSFTRAHDGLQLAVAEEEAPAAATEPVTQAADENTQLISDENAVRRVIERDLADATAEERDIWFEEMKQLPPVVVEDLLRVRRQFPQLRSLHPEIAGPQRPNRLPEGPPDLPTSSVESAWPATTSTMELMRRVALHNIANADTHGYRRLIVVTAAAAFQRDEEPGSRLLGLRLDLSAGRRIATDRSLDVLIEGSGWMVVDAGGQPAYTRGGGLVIDADHKLAIPTPAGVFPIQPGIAIPKDVVGVHCAADGTVMVQHSDQPQPSQLGRIEIVRFRDDAALEVGSDGLYRPTARCGPSRSVRLGEPVDGSVRLVPFCLEGSNVDVDVEFSILERIDRWHAALAPSKLAAGSTKHSDAAVAPTGLP